MGDQTATTLNAVRGVVVVLLDKDESRSFEAVFKGIGDSTLPALICRPEFFSTNEQQRRERVDQLNEQNRNLEYRGCEPAGVCLDNLHASGAITEDSSAVDVGKFVCQSSAEATKSGS